MSSVRKIHLMCGPDVMDVGGGGFKVCLPWVLLARPEPRARRKHGNVILMLEISLVPNQANSSKIEFGNLK